MNKNELTESERQALDWEMEEFQLLYVDNLFATERKRQELLDRLIESRTMEILSKYGC